MSDPANYDGLTIYRGVTFGRVFTLKNSDGSLVDLTGWTGEFKAKAKTDSSPNILDLTAAPGLVMGGTAGTITVTVSATGTGAISEDELVYSLKITSAGTVTGLLYGSIPVSDKVI